MQQGAARRRLAILPIQREAELIQGVPCCRGLGWVDLNFEVPLFAQFCLG